MKWLKWIIRIIFFALFILLMVMGKPMLWLIIFGASLPLTLIFGRFYCGYICPMNTAMEVVDKTSEKLKLPRRNKPKWLKSAFAWGALVISVASMLLLKKLAHINLPIMLIWLGISIIITIFYKTDVFHNYICPFGALQKLFGRFSLFSKRVDKLRCVGCKRCEKPCPTNAITVIDKKAIINTPDCLQCGACQEVCNKDAINYSLKKK